MSHPMLMPAAGHATTPCPAGGERVLPALTVSRLTHAFANRTVLEGISLELAAGQTLALVGPSGCGKSTLLHLCAGLLAVQEGEIHNGFARPAVLFQQPCLLPWKTTLDNIALGLKARGVSRPARLAEATGMAHRLGLDEVALRQFPHQLSGGMQSRAALARALVLSPDLLLLDEPFAALDIGLKAQMHRLLLQAQHTRGLAAVLITHDVSEAITLADRVLVMAGSPGRVVWQLDLPVPAMQRDDAWVLRHTAALLSCAPVRAAFHLPPVDVRAAAASDVAASPSPDAVVGSGFAVPPARLPSHRAGC
ncbi:MAG: ATP-binding cassette domain-containing protein [Lautropia sp.]|nr:ATP-binding cassette domain-containing protein [Lautropia sp.]